MKRYIYSLILLLSTSLLLFANVKVIDTAGCNLAIVGETAPNTYVLKSTSGAHNWFSCVFNGLNTKDATTFTLDMTDTGSELFGMADVSKWEGLYPLYTHGNYLDYSTYIYYTKNDDGYWVSSDIFAKDRLAGNGTTPTQNVIPSELAGEFLSEDEKYWSSWQDIKDTKINVGLNTFTMTKQFNSPNAAVVMRMPYTYEYQLEYMKKLQQANIPGVAVHEIGKSIRNHNLYVVEISDPNATVEELKERRVVLMYGNEDGNESDSSWVVNGAMNFLISGSDEAKQILKEVTFLLIPMLDPVGWSNSTYGAMTYEFDSEKLVEMDAYSIKIKKPREEVIAYLSFILDWITERGMRLDVVCNLHNIECNEGPNVMFPYVDPRYREATLRTNEVLLSYLKNYHTSNAIWVRGFIEKRLISWCTRHWGSIFVFCEVNSRYPDGRLTQIDVNSIGEKMILAFSEYFKSDAYERAFPMIEKRYTSHLEARNKFLETEPFFPKQYHLIADGF